MITLIIVLRVPNNQKLKLITKQNKSKFNERFSFLKNSNYIILLVCLFLIGIVIKGYENFYPVGLNKLKVSGLLMGSSNICIIVAILGAFILNYSKVIDKTYDVIERSIEDDTAFDQEEIPFEVQGALMVVFFIAILPFTVNLFYAKYRSRALKITNKNFPEVYERIELYSRRLGLKKVPEAYLVQENGVLNAFSAFIIRKQYIEINADLFEVAYREHNDLDDVGFVIAHELAHIKLKHATFGYHMSILFSNMIPIISSTASRAREYSCDRVAQKVTGCEGIDAMLVLMVGKHLYKDVDLQDYIENTNNVKGFFVWFYNLTCSHPIMTKRIRALIRKGVSGELY